MSHLLLDYLKDIHRLFDGDLALAIVLAEIAHHSSSRHFTGSGKDAKAIGELKPQDPDLTRLESCSAYSLAAATGLPRETVRRKLARLTELGWVVKTGRAEVRITPKVAEVFLPDFNVRLLDRLLQTGDRIRCLLAP